MSPLLKGKHIFLVPADRASFKSGTSVHDRPDIKKWVINGGGTLEKELTDSVTHVVCQDGDYKEDENFKKAVKMRETRKLNIVTWDWLFQVLSHTKSQPISDYIIKVDPPPKPAGVVSDIHDVFMVGTKEHVNPREQTSLNKVIAAKEVKKREQKAEELNRERIRKDDEARKRAQERQSAKLAKQPGHGLYPNHLIYRDPATGFLFDVRLTKVDILSNTNARVVLTIFESNARPPTYALNMRLEGSKKETKNEELACTGSNYPSTYRLFREAFKELTGVDWDKRFEHCVEGCPYFDMVEAMEYEKRPYYYSIPSVGPTGAPVPAPIIEAPLIDQETTTDVPMTVASITAMEESLIMQDTAPEVPAAPISGSVTVDPMTVQESLPETPATPDALMADEPDYVLVPGGGETAPNSSAAQLDLGRSMLGQRIAQDGDVDMRDFEELTAE